MPEDGPHNRNM